MAGTLSSINLTAFLFKSNVKTLVSLSDENGVSVVVRITPVVLFGVNKVVFSLILLLTCFFPYVPPLFEGGISEGLL